MKIHNGDHIDKYLSNRPVSYEPCNYDPGILVNYGDVSKVFSRINDMVESDQINLINLT